MQKAVPGFDLMAHLTEALNRSQRVPQPSFLRGAVEVFGHDLPHQLGHAAAGFACQLLQLFVLPVFEEYLSPI